MERNPRQNHTHSLTYHDETTSVEVRWSEADESDHLYDLALWMSDLLLRLRIPRKSYVLAQMVMHVMESDIDKHEDVFKDVVASEKELWRFAENVVDQWAEIDKTVDELANKPL